jgi:hypothetical protein
LITTPDFDHPLGLDIGIHVRILVDGRVFETAEQLVQDIEPILSGQIEELSEEILFARAALAAHVFEDTSLALEQPHERLQRPDATRSAAYPSCPMNSLADIGFENIG